MTQLLIVKQDTPWWHDLSAEDPFEFMTGTTEIQVLGFCRKEDSPRLVCSIVCHARVAHLVHKDVTEELSQIQLTIDTASLLATLNIVVSAITANASFIVPEANL